MLTLEDPKEKKFPRKEEILFLNIITKRVAIILMFCLLLFKHKDLWSQGTYKLKGPIMSKLLDRES